MYIKDIVRLDKRKVKVICDEATFPLYASEIKNLGLCTQMDISDDLCTTIFDEILYKRAKERSLHLIEKMDRTEYQIRTKLKDGYYPYEIIERVIAFLNKYNFLNDKDYAIRYAEYSKKTKSSRLILIELSKKGISKEIISDIKMNLDTGQEEIQQIVKLLDKRRYSEACEDIKEKRKIINCLLRRGYDFENINVAIRVYEEQL